MAIDLKVDKKSIGENTKAYSVFFFGFIIFLALFIFTGNKMYAKISKTLNGSKELESDITSLENKIDSLRLLDKEIRKDTKSLTTAFPYEDPSLFSYSELKELSRQNAILFESITFSLGGPAADQVESANIGLNFSGKKEDVLAFISKLTEIAPISGIDAISIGKYAESGEGLEISMSIEVFYSSLPTKLPSDDKAISLLTEEEKEIYEYLTGLEVLVVSELTPSGANDGDINPFFSVFDNVAVEKETPEASPEKNTEEETPFEE